ncbi:MAG: chemotaxis protein CheW [Desulfobulbaceae bacterium]|nr:MAG: chemotaxis protein CheW [Desulfobulbaceae bacterium]
MSKTTTDEEQRQSHRPGEPHATGTATLEGKYLTFHLGPEVYGIDIIKIREIIGIMPITPVPDMPDDAKGVINLRGRVIPIIDLRRRFAMQETPATDRTCIIVVEVVNGDHRHRTTGIIVDSVAEVATIKDAVIEEPPALSSGPDTSFILGMAKLDDGVKILLDIDRILGRQQSP